MFSHGGHRRWTFRSCFSVVFSNTVWNESLSSLSLSKGHETRMTGGIIDRKPPDVYHNVCLTSSPCQHNYSKLTLTTVIILSLNRWHQTLNYNCLLLYCLQLACITTVYSSIVFMTLTELRLGPLIRTWERRSLKQQTFWESEREREILDWGWRSKGQRFVGSETSPDPPSWPLLCLVSPYPVEEQDVIL